MAKQDERNYAVVADQANLYRRPFDCPRVLREFGVALELFLKHTPTGSILDLGCGPGWTSHLLAKAGYAVTGVDIAERMIEIASERAASENLSIDFQVSDMEELDLPKKDFDGVLFFDCLHHCPNYEEVVRRAYAHLKPGGCLILFETTWLHRYSPHAKQESKTFGITELGFSRRQLRRALRQAGFQNLKSYHDAGPPFRGLLGLLKATIRIWFDWLIAFPQAKNIMVAVK